MATLMYATYFEHRVNQLIMGLSTEKEIDEKDIKKILKSTSMEDKCTWLLKILTSEKFDSDSTKKILYLNSMRNEFVHYKWGAKDLGESNEKNLFASLENINEVIKALDDYEDKHLMAGHRKRLKSMIEKFIE